MQNIFFHGFYLYSRFIHQILDLLIKYKLILKKIKIFINNKYVLNE